MCTVCPGDTFEVYNSCASCPSNALAALLLPGSTILIILSLVGLYFVLLKCGIIRGLPTFSLNLNNLIRLKQVGAAMQLLGVFASLSAVLRPWFKSLAQVFLAITLPVEVQPVCATWFGKLINGPMYFVRAYIALAAFSALAAILRYAHKVSERSEAERSEAERSGERVNFARESTSLASQLRSRVNFARESTSLASEVGIEVVVRAAAPDMNVREKGKRGPSHAKAVSALRRTGRPVSRPGCARRCASFIPVYLHRIVIRKRWKPTSHVFYHVLDFHPKIEAARLETDIVQHALRLLGASTLLQPYTGLPAPEPDQKLRFRSFRTLRGVGLKVLRSCTC
jgi:hypothetical protein